MSDFTTSKVDGNSVGATEWNQLADIDNAITSSGQTPATGNLNQLGIAMAINAAGADFYSDSGAANAYVLTAINALRSPHAYFDGMRVRFRPDNANTTASTVNVATLGVKSIKKADGTTDPAAGDISAADDLEIRYNEAAGVFVICPSSTATLRLNTLSNKNAIINGDFNIWQRGTSFTSIADSTYSADCWEYFKNGTMVHDITRSTDVPTVAQAGRLFNYSFLVDCTTADASIAAGEYCDIRQKIEGYNFLPLAQKTITFSFWVKATKTGTYCVFLSNSVPDRSYIAEYTVNVTDTWEFKTVTVTASPSAGTWDYTNGVGLNIGFALATGSTFQTTANSWQTGSFNGTSNQVNACDSTSNNFRICGVQLEVGSVATSFEQRTFQQELLLCQRYYEKTYGIDTAPGAAADTTGSMYGIPFDTTNFNINTSRFSVPKRAAPTVTTYSTGTGASGKLRNEGAGTDQNSSISNVSNFSFNVSGQAGTLTANTGYSWHWVAESKL